MSKVAAHTLNRSAWLDAALDLLAEAGPAAVGVDPLARRLGVTKGSFYHHFRDRQALYDGMLDRWQAVQEGHIERLQSSTSDPPTLLREVMEFIQHKDSSHDVGVRAWAIHHNPARRSLARIDRARLNYLEHVFTRLGFDRIQSRMRARVLYFYQVAEYSLSIRDDEALREQLKDLRIAWFEAKPQR